MNDFDNQPGATAAFDADAAENYIADAEAASPDSIDLSETETEARARLMRANLDQFDLDEEDLALLAGESALADSDDVAAGLPVLAVVGRPNVGKSTLVNRILGRREAVVQEQRVIRGGLKGEGPAAEESVVEVLLDLNVGDAGER